MTREELKSKMDRLLTVAGFLAKITPTAIDDQLLAFAGPLLSQDWALDLIMMLMARFGGKTATRQEMAACIVEHLSKTA